MKRFCFCLALVTGLLMLPPAASPTDWSGWGCFTCLPHDFGVSPDDKCWQVAAGEHGDGIFCEQHYILEHICRTTGGSCYTGGSGSGCWGDECWTGGSPGGGPGGGGGGSGGSCHILFGSFCPAECFSCTYFYY